MNRRFLAVLLAAVAGGGLAVGQGPTGGAPVPSNEIAAPPPDGLAPPEKELTPDEMLAKAKEVVQQAEDVLKALEGIERRAGASGDMMLLECVSTSLVQARGLAESARDRKKSLELSVSAGESDQAKHDSTMLSVIAEKLSAANDKASECLGEDLYDTADATTQFSVDPGTPLDDGTTVDGAPDLQIPLPPPESDPAFML